ncbi:carbohydrate ABC transporter permease [Cutibacterium acnes]
MAHGKTAVTKDGIPYRPSLDGLPPRSIALSKAARTITWVILAVVACYFLLPIIWLVIASTKNNTDLVSTSGFAFGEFNWAANWHSLMAWTKGMFPRWVLNSLLYSTVSGVVGTLISVSCGYVISKFRFPGRRVLLVVIMVGLLMPVALLTVPLYLLFIKMHLVNTMWAMIIPSMVSPFGVFLGNVYADSSVPMELLEAARIDGAGELRIFSTMVLRLLAPAMVTIFLFIFVATWNNFLLPLMMITDENLQPVTQGLYGMMAYFAPDKGAVMLASVIGVVPLVILFLVLQRYWQSGLAAGAVKG